MPSFSEHLVTSTEAALSWFSSRRQKKSESRTVRLVGLDVLSRATGIAGTAAVVLLFLVQIQVSGQGDWTVSWRAPATLLFPGQRVVFQAEATTVLGVPGDVLRWTGDELIRSPFGGEEVQTLSKLDAIDRGEATALLESAYGRDPDSDVLRIAVARRAAGLWVPDEQFCVQTPSGARLVPRNQVHTVIFEVIHGR